MSEYPALVIVLLTYQRTDYMRITVQATRKNLRYPGRILWYVADDGSRPEHLAAVRDELASAELLGWHSERAGYGANANRAWAVSRDVTEYTLWLEDDWTLAREADMTPYIDVLAKNSDVGMIRLAHLAVGLKCESVGYNGAHYLRIPYGQQCAFSGNPAIRHWRAKEAWGDYPTGLNPGETELAYDYQISLRRGPSIVWPVDIGGWGLWGHHGSEKSYA